MNLMKVDTHATANIFRKDHERHFQVETEIIWVWSSNFLSLFTNVKNYYDQYLRHMQDRLHLEKTGRVNKKNLLLRDNYDNINVGKRKYTESKVKKI